MFNQFSLNNNYERNTDHILIIYSHGHQTAQLLYMTKSNDWWITPLQDEYSSIQTDKTWLFEQSDWKDAVY